MLEDTGSGTYIAQVYMSIVQDSTPGAQSVTVYEDDNTYSGRYLMKLVCDLVESPGYAIEKAFIVDVYDFVVQTTPPDIYYLIGSSQ